MRSERHGNEGRASVAETRLEGLAVSPGIAIGPAHIVEAGAVPVPEYSILASESVAEQQRLQTAMAASVKQIDKLKAKAQRLPDAAAEELTLLLDAHRSILSGSRLIRGAERRIAVDKVNAALAVQQEINEIARQFTAMDDAYLAGRAQDVREVGARLIRNLTEEKFRAFSDVTPGSIILAEDITPADTALMDPERIAGFATVLGGPQGHTAIMARSLGLPAVLGVPGLLPVLEPGQTVIVDGLEGTVVVAPDKATLTKYRARRASHADDRKRLAKLTNVAPRTRDGTLIGLHVNLESPREVTAARALGADSVGLLRTEFLFMNRTDLPSEDEQFEALAQVVAGMDGQPVTIRTLDVGGDKLASALGRYFTEAPNPALGLRAIRLSLRDKTLLNTQLAAILRAAALGPARVLLPMITGTGQIRAVRKAMGVVARRLRRKGVTVPDDLPPIGAMIEIPAAALNAPALADCADFFALGTNDLVMYTLAIDRGDDQVAPMYDPLHPAVLKLVAHSVDAAEQAGIPISACGEIAGDPRFTALLLGLGVRDLSMSPGSLLSIKQRLMGLDLATAAERAKVVLAQHDPGRIAALVDDFNEIA